MTRPDPALRGLCLAGVVVCCASAALAAVIEVLLSPFYIGSILVPVAVVLALASNIVLPFLARRMVDSIVAAAAPVLVWVITVLLLSSARPEGDVLLPGGTAGQVAVSYGILGVGLVAGLVTVALAGRGPSVPAADGSSLSGSPR